MPRLHGGAPQAAWLAACLLLQARALPEMADLVRDRNVEATRELAADLAGVSASPKETARLLVAATAEAALTELEARKRQPRLREALLALVPDRS